MKEIVVISGKGGTGKTTITASFAYLQDNKVMADCDVDAADLHLLLAPEVEKKEKFVSGKTAVINSKKCVGCGQCESVCRFDAIHENKIDPIACEGCAFCSHICPYNAIEMKPNLCGYWFRSKTQYGPMVHAALGAGEENSGRLVSVVRKKAKEIAQEENREMIITDGPPGTGCAVLSSLTGADMALIVTEPTCSGLHDLKRIITVAQTFRLKICVCINKYDINIDMTQQIKLFCESEGIKIIGNIPFDRTVVEALVQGKLIVQRKNNKVAQNIISMWKDIKQILKEEKDNE